MESGQETCTHYVSGWLGPRCALCDQCLAAIIAQPTTPHEAEACLLRNKKYSDKARLTAPTPAFFEAVRQMEVVFQAAEHDFHANPCRRLVEAMDGIKISMPGHEEHELGVTELAHKIFARFRLHAFVKFYNRDINSKKDRSKSAKLKKVLGK